MKAGDVVVELDSTSFVLEIKDRTLQLNQAEIDLQRQLEPERRGSRRTRRWTSSASGPAVKRAEVDADVPEGILPKRDYLEKQLVLRAGPGRRGAGRGRPGQPARRRRRGREAEAHRRREAAAGGETSPRRRSPP